MLSLIPVLCMVENGGQHPPGAQRPPLPPGLSGPRHPGLRPAPCPQSARQVSLRQGGPGHVPTPPRWAPATARLGLAELDEAPLLFVLPVSQSPQPCLAAGHPWPHAWDCQRSGLERVLEQGTTPGAKPGSCHPKHSAGPSPRQHRHHLWGHPLCHPHGGTPTPASVSPQGGHRAPPGRAEERAAGPPRRRSQPAPLPPSAAETPGVREGIARSRGSALTSALPPGHA